MLLWPCLFCLLRPYTLSTNQLMLIVPKTKTKLEGDHVFSVVEHTDFKTGASNFFSVRGHMFSVYDVEGSRKKRSKNNPNPFAEKQII